MKSSYFGIYHTITIAIVAGLWATFWYWDDLEKIDATINGLFAPVTEVVQSIVFYSFKAEVGGIETSVPIVVVWLILTAIILTFQFRFINFTGFKQAIRFLRVYLAPLMPLLILFRCLMVGEGNCLI